MVSPSRQMRKGTSFCVLSEYTCDQSTHAWLCSGPHCWSVVCVWYAHVLGCGAGNVMSHLDCTDCMTRAIGSYLPRYGPAHFCRGHIYESGRGDAILSLFVHLCKTRSSQLHDALICQNHYLILQQPRLSPARHALTPGAAQRHVSIDTRTAKAFIVECTRTYSNSQNFQQGM